MYHTLIYVRVLQSSAPSAAVVSLEGVNISSTALRISWLPPPLEDQNGMIENYTVSYGLPTQDRSQYTIRSTSETMIDLTDLEKFTDYTVFVSAVTISSGPEDSVTVQTDSDCECLCWVLFL